MTATEAAIARWGLHALTLERIAAEAGMSRATIYRRAVSVEQLVAVLADRVAGAFRDAVWPAVVSALPGAKRLAAALWATCELADAHLALLGGMFLSGEQVFHRPGPDAVIVDVFAEPFERILRDGAADGSLRVASPAITATVLFNMVGWSYIHLRVAHHWERDSAREAVIDLALRGLTTPPDL